LFFIAATFYILGRSHGVLDHRVPLNDNAVVTEEVLMQAPDYYESGRAKLVAGEIEDAIADLTTAIDSGEPTADMFILRGEAYMQSASYGNALNDFNMAIDMDPASSVAYYDRALLNTRLEDYNAALNDINNALAVRATNDQDILQLRDLYAKRGQLNLWLKNWEGAIADYTNSLARPDGVVNPSVYAERAEAYTATGDYVAAINDYSAAVRVISEQIQGADSAAERELMSSNAMSYFEKSAALNLQLGNMEASRSDLESALTIAAALNDSESVERLQALIADMNQ
jgi:tetratricopeptide (TPR) repeat protein